MFLGFFLVAFGIIASIFFHFYFWYTFYLVGAFMFFGSLNYKTHAPSVYAYLLKNQWKHFLTMYGLALLIGLVVDIFYGRTFSSLWYYPHLNGFWNFFFPVFLYYPFGAFQVYEIFYAIRHVCQRYLSAKQMHKISYRTKELIINALIIIGILGIILPPLNYLLNGNRYANELMTVVIMLTPFFIDAVIYKRNKTSIFFDFLQGKPFMVATMVLAWLTCVLLTEFPNTFSYEWIYINIPFIQKEILGINVMIFTFGWFSLVFMPVRCIDFIKLLFKKL